MINISDRRIELEPSLNKLEWINDSIRFLGQALVEYPNEGGLEEAATILSCLSESAQRELSDIKKMLALA